MNRRARILTLLALLSPIAGCEAFLNFVGANTTKVLLVNNADYVVEVDIYADDQNTARELLTLVGTKIEYTLAPGQQIPFSRDCDDLQVIVIDDAVLNAPGLVRPDADTDVQREDTEFDCGDTIIFTFDHSASVNDFHINIEVRKAPVPF